MPGRVNDLYTLAPAELDSLLQAADQNGERIAQWSLAACADKQALLARMACDLGFAASFGHNWDALSDSLCDLDWQHWQPGLILAFTHTTAWRRHNPDDLAILSAVLQDACAFWQRRNQSFCAFMATV